MYQGGNKEFTWLKVKSMWEKKDNTIYTVYLTNIRLADFEILWLHFWVRILDWFGTSSHLFASILPVLTSTYIFFEKGVSLKNNHYKTIIIYKLVYEKEILKMRETKIYTRSEFPVSLSNIIYNTKPIIEKSRYLIFQKTSMNPNTKLTKFFTKYF